MFLLSTNVKWLIQIHVQEEQYLGTYQARWYRTLKGEMIDGEMKWKETAITRMQLKSFIARVTRDGRRHKVFGVVLNDGMPLKSVEVRVDDAWQPATMDASTSGKYSWKLFTCTWNGATPGSTRSSPAQSTSRARFSPPRKNSRARKLFSKTIRNSRARC